MDYAEHGVVDLFVNTASRSGGRTELARFGRPVSDPIVIADKLTTAQDARAKGPTAEDAARLVGWSRTTLYRHHQALATRQSDDSISSLAFR
ncbi:hypothetical protein GCM10009589_12900 [Arthrobacter pascens]